MELTALQLEDGLGVALLERAFLQPAVALPAGLHGLAVDALAQADDEVQIRVGQKSEPGFPDELPVSHQQEARQVNDRQGLAHKVDPLLLAEYPLVLINAEVDRNGHAPRAGSQHQHVQLEGANLPLCAVEQKVVDTARQRLQHPQQQVDEQSCRGVAVEKARQSTVIASGPKGLTPCYAGHLVLHPVEVGRPAGQEARQHYCHVFHRALVVFARYFAKFVKESHRSFLSVWSLQNSSNWLSFLIY